MVKYWTKEELEEIEVESIKFRDTVWYPLHERKGGDMFNLQDDLLFVTLPTGKTQEELILDAKSEIYSLASSMYGKHIKINGRITTGMALMLGHTLAHICRSVSIFDPKENQYFLCISH